MRPNARFRAAPRSVLGVGFTEEGHTVGGEVAVQPKAGVMYA